MNGNSPERVGKPVLPHHSVLKTAMMVDKRARPAEVSPPIPGSPLVNAALASVLIATQFPAAPHVLALLSCLSVLASTYSTFHDSKTVGFRLGGFSWAPTLLAGPGGAAPSGLSLLQVIGLCVIILSLDVCPPGH